MKFIDEIIHNLNPYKDKVFLCPLNKNEIHQIEKNYSRKLPQYYKYFLSKIGLRQDLIWGLNEKMSDFKDISEFISSNEYFRVGNNGGEDYWLLKFEDEQDRNIYEYDYYCNGEIIPTSMTFDSLLNDSFEQLKKNYSIKKLNSDKNWWVEFSINTGNIGFFAKELQKYINIKIINEPTKIIDSKENEFNQGLIEIEGKQISIRKSSYLDSSLSFYWNESVLELNNNPTMNQINNALKKCIFKHNMIELGAIDLEN